MSRACLRAVAGLCIAGAATGYACGAVAAPASVPPESDEPTAPSASAPADLLTGDTITMTSGKVLMGFQVLRETVSHYVVEIIPSEQTLRLPKALVESVVYDDIDPRSGPPDSGDGASAAEPVLLAGQQMEVRLIDALSKDISEPEFPIEDMDYLEALEEISKRTGVRIRVDVSVTGIPPESRKWTYDVPSGANGMTLIDALTRTFRDLRAVYQEDDVLVTTRAERPSGQSPAPSPTPE